MDPRLSTILIIFLIAVLPGCLSNPFEDTEISLEYISCNSFRLQNQRDTNEFAISWTAENYLRNENNGNTGPLGPGTFFQYNAFSHDYGIYKLQAFDDGELVDELIIPLNRGTGTCAP